LKPTFGVEVNPQRVQEQEFMHRVPAIKQNNVMSGAGAAYIGDEYRNIGIQVLQDG